MVQWLLQNWWILILLLAAGTAVTVVLLQRRARAAEWERVRMRGLRYAIGQLDAATPTGFELAVRDLLRRDGAQAERMGGGGDDACDVLATDPAGRRWVVQCKHRRDGLAGAAVGTPVLQQVNGTARPIHGAHVVVVATNGRFSSKAVPWAQRQQILLVDRNVLAVWAAGSRPLWEVLGVALPPPRRATPLS